MGYIVTFEYQGAVATLEVWDGGNTATLATITSKWRKRGMGAQAMQLMLAYADAFHMEVNLEVHPFGDEPRMPDHELKAWYRTFGFVPTGGDTMRRPRALTEEQKQNAFPIIT